MKTHIDTMFVILLFFNVAAFVYLPLIIKDINEFFRPAEEDRWKFHFDFFRNIHR